MRSWRFAKWYLLALRDGTPDFSLDRLLQRQEKMSSGQIEVLRTAKTRRLVDECLRNVPYYRELMRRAGLDPRAVRGPQDLAVLPLLDKPTIRREGRRLLNEAADPADYFAHTTSGSSGMPLDFYRGKEYDRLANGAANMRAYRRMGWRPGDVMARFWSPPHDEPAPMGAGRALRRALRRWLEPDDPLFSAYAVSRVEMEGWLDRLRAARPRFLYGYGSVLSLYASYLHSRGLSFDGVRGIASTAEALIPAARALLGEVFHGAMVIDVYGSREIPGIACECRLGNMHVNSDLVHVEYLPVPGDPGRRRLVITALDNTVFPFIRYDIGDHGSPLEEPCRCGLPFPAMRWGLGKLIDSLLSPEGRLMYGGWFEGLMYRVRGIHEYQFRQKQADEITLYIVPTDEFGDETREHLKGVEREIRRDFSPRIRLRVETVASIPLTPAGKHRFVICEVRRPEYDYVPSLPLS